MRILHVTDAYLPTRGGIETQVHDLAEQQLAQGHDVRVVTRTHGRDAGNVPVVRASTGHGPRDWWRTAQRIGPQLTDADQLHAHLSVLSPAALIALREATRRGVPAVATYHSVLPASAHRGLPLRRLPFDPAEVAWTAVSEVAASSVRHLLGPAHPVGVLPNGLDLTPWRKVAQDRDACVGGEFIVCAVGRLALRKRPFALLHVLAEAQRQLISAGSQVRLRLVLVGGGRWERVLRIEARRLGLLDQIELTGDQERFDVARYLARSDAFLSTATKESFGIAAMEARAAGLPILARTGTGLAELLENDVEALLAPDDGALASSLAMLASHSERWRAMQTHNRTVAPLVGWPETLHLTDLAYKRSAGLVNGQRSR